MATTDATAANERLVRRFVRDVWNGEDLDAIEELATDDLVVHQLGAGNDRDRDSFREFHAELLAAVPDLTHDVRATAVDGDEVWVHATLGGTPERDYRALAATGESFSTDGFQRYRIDGGAVAELWVLPNAMGMLAQLGVLPDSPGTVLRLLGRQAKAKLFGG